MIVTAVGSYPKVGPPGRAPNLRATINRYDSGDATSEEVLQAKEETIKDVLHQQAEAGLDLATDGQIQRDDGQAYFAQGIKGFSINGLIRYFDTNTYYRHPMVETNLEWQGPISVVDYKFAVQHSPLPVKAIITGPYTMARLSQPGYYQDRRSLAMALAAILNREALALQEAGADLIQFDEPAIAKWPEEFPLFLETSDIVTRGLSTKTAVYTWFRDIASISPDFFHLPFQVFGLDFVWGPANWQAIKHFPADKELGLGLVDGRNTRMEPVEEVVASIHKATQYVSPDRLHINPSCGLDYLPRQNAYRKLVLLVEGANKARGVS